MTVNIASKSIVYTANKKLLVIIFFLLFIQLFSMSADAYDLLALGKHEGNYHTILVGKYDEENVRLDVFYIPSRAVLPGGNDPVALELKKDIREVMVRLNELLDTEVHDYIIFDYSGAKALVDELGGVKFKSPFNFVLQDSAKFEKGWQELDGKKACNLLLLNQKIRGDVPLDLKVIKIQERFLLALLEKALNNKIAIVKVGLGHLNSLEINIPLITFISMLFKGLKTDTHDVEYTLQTVTGRPVVREGLVTYMVDKKY